MIITVCRLHDLILCEALTLALECEALALNYEALALRTSGLGLVLLGLDLGLDTVGLVNITGNITCTPLTLTLTIGF